MRDIATLFFLITAACGALAACTAATAKRLLWGLIIASFGLGISIEVALEGYLGVLVVSVFLVTDVVLYLFLRTQEFFPLMEMKLSKFNMVYRISVLWAALASAIAGSIWIYSTERTINVSGFSESRMSALYEKIWGADWIIMASILFSIALLVVGGFFLVRKENK
jgi:hypothetical protein